MAHSDNRESIIQKIEEICLTLMEQIVEGNCPELLVSRKRDWSGSDTTVRRAQSNSRVTAIRFSNRRSAGKFGVIMKVISAIHSLLMRDQYCTKRDLYYQDPELYGNQRYLDQLIDTISSMLSVPRWQLHVVATSKGVISGDLTFLDADRKLVDCTSTRNGVLLPSLIHKVELLQSNAKLVIVVEKDATFQHLIEGRVTNELGPCIIVTTHAHDVHNLSIPSLVWLGVLPSDMDSLHLPEDVALDLSTRDRAQVQDIMNRGYMTGLSQELTELQLMLSKNKKMEIQCLDVFGRNYLTQVYLPDRLRKLGYHVQPSW